MFSPLLYCILLVHTNNKECNSHFYKRQQIQQLQVLCKDKIKKSEYDFILNAQTSEE